MAKMLCLILFVFYALLSIEAAGVASPQVNTAKLQQLLAQTKHEAAVDLASLPAGTKIYGEYSPNNAPVGEPGKTTFQGDIIQNVIPGGVAFDTVRNKALLWPNGRVPYIIGNGFTKAQLALIQIAIEEFQHKTCIQFVPKTDSDNDYVHFWKVKFLSQCGSAAGKQGGEQKIVFASFCFDMLGKIMHEMLHAVGFYHEQSRLDRDQFVFINFTNVKNGQERQFDKLKVEEIDDQGLPYDYASLMHYDKFGFAKNPKIAVITPLKELPEGLNAIGQRQYFSDLDITKLNMLYKCEGKIGQQCDTEKEVACTESGGGGETCARKCDGITQCADGADEKNCPRPTCDDSDYWPCMVAKCIPKSWLCDSKRDCLGGEDELPENCHEIKCNPKTEFKCESSGKCVQSFRVCDGVGDCQRGEDEGTRMCSARQQPPRNTGWQQSPFDHPFFSSLFYYNPCGPGYAFRRDFGLLSYFGAPVCIPQGFLASDAPSGVSNNLQRHCFIDVASLWQRKEIQVTLDSLAELLALNGDGTSACDVVAIGYANVVLDANGNPLHMQLPEQASGLIRLLQKAKAMGKINGFVVVTNSANELRTIGSDLTKAKKFGEQVRSELRKLNATGILLEWLRPLPNDKAAFNTLIKVLAEAMQYDPTLKSPRSNGVRLLIGLNVLPAIKAAHDKDLILKNVDFLNVIPDERDAEKSKTTFFTNRLLTNLPTEIVKKDNSTWLSTDSKTRRRINVGISLAPITWTLTKFQTQVGGLVQSPGFSGPISGTPGMLNAGEMCVVGNAQRTKNVDGYRALQSFSKSKAGNSVDLYATSQAERQWIAYESAESLAKKLRHVTTALQTVNGIYITDVQNDDPSGLCGKSNSFAMTRTVLKFSDGLGEQI